MVFRNKFYWRFYDSAAMSFFYAIKQNPRSFLLIFFDLFVHKILFKKNIVVYLLHGQHLGWVEGLIGKLSKAKGFNVVLITHDPKVKTPYRSVKVFSFQQIKDHKGQSILPVLFCDLYLTPASTNCKNVPLLKKKINFFHSVVSVDHVYEADSFDGYDYIFCVGPHHIEEMSRWYMNRKLTGKTLIPGGYPKIDQVIKRCSEIPPQTNIGINHVIFAPTFLNAKTAQSSALFNSGEIIIKTVLEKGLYLTLRPHPFNMNESDPYFLFVSNLIESFKSHKNFKTDTTSDYFESYKNTCFMITDLSGTGFTYGLGFNKPVVFFDQTSDQGAHKLGVEFTKRTDLGALASSQEELSVIIDEMSLNYASYQQKISTFRKVFLFNLGRSEDYFMQCLPFILKNKKMVEWTSI